ncbi:MAG: hypothetical protein H7Y31_18360 [Chitinophagaceae bacterium]|nr:hypothetical protein [Chitinophagaceae bacterium]
MAINLFDRVNNMMGAPVTKKESPVSSTKVEYEKTLPGAAIPTALAGIFELASSADGANKILDHLVNHRGDIENANSPCIDFTFGTTVDDVVNKVANYSGTTYADAHSTINDAARNGYRVLIQELVKETIKPEDITKYMVSQRHSILTHLPAELQMGHLLGDETIDDVSNKMEGPISNLMHKLGGSFSKSAK